VLAGFGAATLEVGVDHVDAHSLTIGESRDKRAEGLRGATSATDDAAEILGVHAHLKDLATWRVLCDYLHLVGVINDPLDEVFESGVEQP
jgi:hypothetical protein